MNKTALLISVALMSASCGEDQQENPPDTHDMIESLDIAISASYDRKGLDLKRDFHTTSYNGDLEKIELGRKLFYDENLSQVFQSESEGVSCATCHTETRSGYPITTQEYHQYGHPRTFTDDYNPTPKTFINSAHTPNYYTLDEEGVLIPNGDTTSLHNGACGGYTDINKGVNWMYLYDEPWGFGNFVLQDLMYLDRNYNGFQIQSIIGQGVHRISSDKFELAENAERDSLPNKAITDYLDYVKAEYGVELVNLFGGDYINDIGVGMAITEFERSVVTTKDPDNLYNGGDLQALTDRQKYGKYLFSELGCVDCHNGKSYGGGYYVSPHDRSHEDQEKPIGRFVITGRDEDLYKVRTPQLKNIKDHTTLMASQSLEDFVLNTDGLDRTTKGDLDLLIDWLVNGNYDDELELSE